MSDEGGTALVVHEEHTEERLMQFLYRAPIGLIQIAPDGTVEMMNPMSVQLLMPVSESAGLDNLFDILGAAAAAELRGHIATLDPLSGRIHEPYRVTFASPGDTPQTLSIDMTRLDPRRLMAVVTDITAETERERRNLALQLRRAARIDSLTCMPNRTALLERLQSVIHREAADADYEFALFHVNCDRFKSLNEHFGHQAGDEVLSLMAARLRAAIRPSDSVNRPVESEPMAARVNGDEFVILFEGLGRRADIEAIAERLLDVLARPYLIGADQVFAPASIGVASRKDAVHDAGSLLQDAGMATRQAKNDGGARYTLFEPAMRERASARALVEKELRRALVTGELFVVYQPVVGLRDGPLGGAMTGVEALVRWRHPTRGVVSPIVFIDVSEQTGLIVPLGEFVLFTACKQFMAWRAELETRAPGTLAVNVSRAQLASSRFVESVSEILRSTAMTAGSLQLEVTESLAAQDEQIQQRLHELKALGVTIALDDFGTGYSSLSSLHLLPVDTVKIDRSFVSLADSSEHHRVLIEATVRVARSLGMNTVAEGVETKAQAEVICALGCDKCQGYYFSAPMEAADTRRWWTDFERREWFGVGDHRRIDCSAG